MRYTPEARCRAKNLTAKIARQSPLIAGRQTHRLQDALGRFRRSDGCSVLITFSLLLPVLIMVVGIAIDYGLVVRQKTKMQQAADSAAIAAASGLNVVNAYDNSADQTTTVAKSSVAANLKGDGQDFKIAVKVDTETATVHVQLTQSTEQAFLGSHSFTDGTLTVNATAQVIGQMPVCVIGLDEKPGKTIALESHARITAENCAVYSNSTSTNGLSLKSYAVLHAVLICSVGGKVGGKANFEPEPLTDCPVVEDPLRDRPAPSGSSCKETDLESNDKIVTLTPGVYCGGIKIDGHSRVHLKPGIYVVKDGPLIVKSEAELEGEFVGNYLKGDKATFRFDTNTKIDLSAPKDGKLAAPPEPHIPRFRALALLRRELLQHAASSAVPASEKPAQVSTFKRTNIQLTLSSKR